MLSNITDEALQQLLLDFKGQLSFLGLSIDEERVIQQSRQAYLLSERLRMTQNQNRTGEEILSESDSSESDILPEKDIIGQRGRELFEKKHSALNRKGIREAKRRTAERRF